MTVTCENLEAFLRRDWPGRRASKDLAISRYVAAHGTTATFQLAQALLDHAWPAVMDLPRDDLAGLLKLRRKLDRAHARRRQLARAHR